MKADAVFMVVGIGLMGGSYAMALSKKGYTVLGVDANPEAVAYALQKGLITKGAHAADTEACAELVSRADYIILALYPHENIPWLRHYKNNMKKGALITDLAGVKACFVEEAQRLLAPEIEFIPTHPMAGREVSGVQNATETLFIGANFLITPTAYNTQAGLSFAHWLAHTLGFACITELSVAQHDAAIGYVSQLTHAIAVSLMNANDDPLLPSVTGDSFRDLTRIADINAELWSELFLENAGVLSGEIDQFISNLQNLQDCLKRRDREELVRLFNQSGTRRRAFGQSRQQKKRQQEE